MPSTAGAKKGKKTTEPKAVAEDKEITEKNGNGTMASKDEVKPKKAGRPAKTKAVTDSQQNGSEVPAAEVKPADAKPMKVGRPTKEKAVVNSQKEKVGDTNEMKETVVEPSEKKKVVKPKKTKTETTKKRPAADGDGAPEAKKDATSDEDDMPTATATKKEKAGKKPRGRPKGATKNSSPKKVQNTGAVAKRGRPKKVASSTESD